MPQGKYRGVSVSKYLLKDVEEFINAHPEAGYKSIADFVSESIRCRMQNVRTLYSRNISDEKSLKRMMKSPTRHLIEI